MRPVRPCFQTQAARDNAIILQIILLNVAKTEEGKKLSLIFEEIFWIF